MDEMERRGYKPDKIWRSPNWRGKVLGECANWCDTDIVKMWYECKQNIYEEHDGFYLEECLDNLADKGVKIDMNYVDIVKTLEKYKQVNYEEEGYNIIKKEGIVWKVILKF